MYVFIYVRSNSVEVSNPCLDFMAAICLTIFAGFEEIVWHQAKSWCVALCTWKVGGSTFGPVGHSVCIATAESKGSSLVYHSFI